MPAVECGGRTQKAVLWEATGLDDYGQPVVGQPEEVLVRWDETDAESPDAIAISATVVMPRRVAEGSEMWLGSLDDYGAQATAPTRMRVVSRSSVQDVRGRKVHHTAGLARLGAATPNFS
jgi:hypothetical protein